MAYTEAEKKAIHERAKATLDRKPEQPQTWGERTKAERDQAELEERCARYVAGDRQALDGMDEVMPRSIPTVLNAAQRQVRTSYEQQRPTLDSATQSLWEAFIAQQCEAIISAKFLAFADIVGEETGRSERQFFEKMRSLRGPWREELHADLLKRFSKDFTAMRDDLLAVLRAELGLRGDNVVDLPNPISRKA